MKVSFFFSSFFFGAFFFFLCGCFGFLTFVNYSNAIPRASLPPLSEFCLSISLNSRQVTFGKLRIVAVVKSLQTTDVMLVPVVVLRK